MEALLRVLDSALSPGWTDALLARFSTLADVLAASPEAQARATGSRAVADLLLSVRRAQLHALRIPLIDRPIVSSSETLRAYLHGRLAHQGHECLHVLYLDARNHLLRDETAATGSVSEVTMHPRTILHRALDVGATALIVVHNHPSGDPEPSADDRHATHRLAAAASSLDIRIHDHLIVARRGTISFRAAGLL
nr:DNA repair protein RadC [Sphingomonas sp. ID1715]